MKQRGAPRGTFLPAGQERTLEIDWIGRLRHPIVEGA